MRELRYKLLPGRHIEADGVPVAYVQRTGDNFKGWPMAPAEVDTLAHHIVAALNVLEVLPEITEFLTHPDVRHMICSGESGCMGEQARYHKMADALAKAARTVAERRGFEWTKEKAGL